MKVGYGRPPKAHRFKPGQSGNPKGRRKKPKALPDIGTALDKVFSRQVTITDNGQSRSVHVLEAMILSLVSSATRGNAKALLTLVKLAQAFPPTVERVYGYNPEDAEKVRRKIADMIRRKKELEQSQARVQQPSEASTATALPETDGPRGATNSGAGPGEQGMPRCEPVDDQRSGR